MSGEKQKTQFMKTTMMRVSKVMKDASGVLERAEAKRLLEAYMTRDAEKKAREAFRLTNPPPCQCITCDKGFAYDDDIDGLTRHLADSFEGHRILLDQEDRIRPRYLAVQKAFEELELKQPKEYPKLYIFTRHAYIGQPFPVLDQPNEKFGRTIGGLDQEGTVKALKRRGEWLKIEYKNEPNAWVHYRKGFITYLSPLHFSATQPSTLGTTANFATTLIPKALSTTIGSSTILPKLFMSSTISASTLNPQWPIKVGRLNYYIENRYFKAAPSLPEGIELKVRYKPDLKSKVVGVLKPNMLVCGKGESGDWIMVEFRSEGCAWVLRVNRMGKELVVEEEKQEKILMAQAAKVSPFCLSEEGKTLSSKELEDDESQDSIVKFLASTVLKDSEDINRDNS